MAKFAVEIFDRKFGLIAVLNIRLSENVSRETSPLLSLGLALDGVLEFE